MALMGVGLGLIIQVLVLVVQATVEHRDIGVATAALGFTQQLGGALGATVAVTVYSNGFDDAVAGAFTAAERASIPEEALRGSPDAIAALDPAVRVPLIEAFADGLTGAFAFGVLPMIAAAAVFAFVRHRDLPTELEPPVRPEPVVPV
jgi:hypothetical protein